MDGPDVCMFGHVLKDSDYRITKVINGNVVTVCMDHEAKIVRGVVPDKIPMVYCDLNSAMRPRSVCAFCNFPRCEHSPKG